MTLVETTRGYGLPNSDGEIGVPVTVRLFGILALLTHERLVELTLAKSSTAGDVLRELGKRFGADFLARILRVPGELSTYCALFVNGEQVDDLNTKIAADRAAAEIAVILFMASEGG
jgi:molybdopterin converting factor small subunit